MTKTLCLMFAGLAAVPLAALAQESGSAPANPISASEKGMYAMLSSGTAIAAAEKMPEEYYSFKPTPDVRSFGQLVGHLADSQYYFCSTAAGETTPASNIEKSKTAKADLLVSLKDAVSYCTKVYAGMTDAKGAQMVKLMNFDLARLTVLSANTAHMDEHYGNMVTYMRLKGIVPPTSDKSTKKDSAAEK
ncbi:MAG TPA: DinB family protein [Bryobacteraceae bacterium]|nr:DinB family protein [Bryobacteraceae bacterium]